MPASYDRVVGGGFYSDFASLRISEAWAFFGEANGVASLAEMRARVGHYRRAPIGPGEDPFIGCVFVRDITFFGSNELAEPPPAFAPNIVQGKSYDMLAERVHSYFEELLSRLLAPPLVLADDGATWHRPGPAYGDPRLQRQRLGQRAFQAVVLDAYSRKCAR